MELVQKRQAVLDRTAKDMKDGEEDAVLQGKIVEIVFHNAQATIAGENRLLRMFDSKPQIRFAL